MKELQKILTLDRLIAEKKADIEINKRELIALEASRNAAAISALGRFDNLTELEDGEVKWKIQKGCPSVVIRDDVEIDSIPEELTRRSPDKRLILKAAKTNPESISAFPFPVRFAKPLAGALKIDDYDYSQNPLIEDRIYGSST